MAQETVEIPISGKIVGVNITVGDVVKEGEVLCILESMKMENPIVAPLDGSITHVGVTIEQMVKPGDVVAVIEF